MKDIHASVSVIVLMFHQNVYIACLLNEFIIYQVFRSIRHTFSWEMPNSTFFCVLWSKWASALPSKQLRFPCLPQQDRKKQSLSCLLHECFTSAQW